MGMCPFSMFLFWIIIYALLMMVAPQLIRSIMSIIYSFPYYIKVIEKWLNSFVEHGWKLNPEMLDMINQYCKSTESYYRYSSADAGYAQKCFSRYF